MPLHAHRIRQRPIRVRQRQRYVIFKGPRRHIISIRQRANRTLVVVPDVRTLGASTEMVRGCCRRAGNGSFLVAVIAGAQVAGLLVLGRAAWLVQDGQQRVLVLVGV